MNIALINITYMSGSTGKIVKQLEEEELKKGCQSKLLKVEINIKISILL